MQFRLTAAQERAMDALMTGASVTAAAKVAGVNRNTVSDWLNRHTGFVAEYGRRRRELWSALRGRLSALATKAVDVLEAELDEAGPKRLDAAIHVLRATSLYDAGDREVAVEFAGTVMEAIAALPAEYKATVVMAVEERLQALGIV